LILKRISQAAISQVTIDGLDEALGKKLQPRQNILLLGPPLSGKSTLAIQFLTSGLRAGEAAVFVTTTDTPRGIKERAKTFGWNLEEHENRGELKYIDCYSKLIGVSFDDSAAVVKAGIGEENLESTLLMISSIISDLWAEGRKLRFVFDNLTTLFYYCDLYEVARFLHQLLGRLKAANATSIFILEAGVHDEQVTTVLRSLCDGVLQLTGDDEQLYIQGILGVGALGRHFVELSKHGLRVMKAPTNRAA
jgi:KaiC/GvpD/RAD55 family RecA-like ATPase